MVRDTMDPDPVDRLIVCPKIAKELDAWKVVAHYYMAGQTKALGRYGCHRLGRNRPVTEGAVNAQFLHMNRVREGYGLVRTLVQTKGI
jgi:hypothetical protein